MTDFVPSIVIDEVIDQLAAFVTLFMQGGIVTRAQVNRVPMPKVPNAVLTELLQVDIHLPHAIYNDVPDKAVLSGTQRIDIQVDVYGPLAGEICNAIKTAFRTSWAYDYFPQAIKPLYTSDGIQSPLVTGEQQYESRWTLTVSMQYNPTTTVPQQSAIVANVTETVPVDVFNTLI